MHVSGVLMDTDRLMLSGDRPAEGVGDEAFPRRVPLAGPPHDFRGSSVPGTQRGERSAVKAPFCLLESPPPEGTARDALSRIA